MSTPDTIENAFVAGYLAGSHCEPSWTVAVRERGLGSITAQVILLTAGQCWREWLATGQPAPAECTTMWEPMHE